MGKGKAVYKHTACDSFRAGRHCHYNDDDCARSKNAGKMLITEFPSYWSNLQNVINDLTSRFNLEEIVLPSLDINDENISEMLKNLIHSDMTNKIFNTALDMTTSVIGVIGSQL